MSKQEGADISNEQPVVEAAVVIEAADAAITETKLAPTETPQASPVEVTTPTAVPDQKKFDTAWVKESLGKFKDYSPFIHNVGSRALYGAAFGGLFGLLFFKRTSMRTFSVLYGAGFGLGMCAPQINQLRKDFIEVGTGKDLAGTPRSDEEFYAELDSIKQEIVLRNKFRH